MKFSLLFFYFALILMLTACGYKPSSYYAKKQLNGKIFVDLIVDLKDPRNAVLIKDAMNELIVHRLDAKIVDDKNLADTNMIVKLNSVSMKELHYDKQGYNKLYKAVVSIDVKYNNKKESQSFTVSGEHDFSIDDGSTITDIKRFEAIKSAANKALEDIISRLAINSLKN